MTRDPGSTREPRSLCIVAPEAYPTLAGLDVGIAGGAELQLALIATGLAEEGWAVSFIAGDYGQPSEQVIQGVRVLRSYKVGYGNRKFRYPLDTLSMYRAMNLARASVYLQRCVFHHADRVALYCLLHRAKFVFSAGIDANADPVARIPNMRLQHRLTYPWAIGRAEALICQNADQRDGFQRNYRREATVLPNLVPDSDVLPQRTHEGEGSRVLWVGTFSERKRPWVILDLAGQFPQLTFTIAGIEADPSLTQKLRDDASRLPNVRWLGFVPPKDAMSLFRDADIFISTATSEGFPNTFLHAMCSGVPILSLNVDPDGVLERSGAGIVCADDVTALVRNLASLAADPVLRTRMAQAELQYVRTNHASSAVLPLYSQLLSGLDEQKFRRTHVD